MILNESSAYFLSFIHLQGIRRKKIRYFLDKVIENGAKLEDIFNSPNKYYDLFKSFEDVLEKIPQENENLTKYAFILENLSNKDIDIINIWEDDYPANLKLYLKDAAPLLLYTKGNKDLLKEECIAVVGRRDATEISLEFTKNISKKLSKEYKVIVSGYAKGVDKEALESALEVKGHSIIVLPQGILTANSIFNKYSEQIKSGDLLIMSTYYPSSPWSVPQAMERNAYIYGLSNEIYVSETNNSGGTWAGAINGLRYKRKVYVRIPGSAEKNSNILLIEKGAIGIDKNLEIIIDRMEEPFLLNKKIEKVSEKEEQGRLFNI